MERYRDFKTRIPKEKKQEDVTPHYEPAPTFIPTTDSFAQLLSSVGNAAVAEFFDRLEIQAKLKTSAPGDFYERQADRIVVSLPLPTPNYNHKKPIRLLNRLFRSRRQARSPKSKSIKGRATGATIPTGIEAEIKQLKGKGAPLPSRLMDLCESRLGAAYGCQLFW